MNIGYDREESTEMEPRYFVYDDFEVVIIYKGTYAQCLCVQGAKSLDENTTIDEIRSKTNGYV